MFFYYVAFVLALVSIDQITKFYAVQNLIGEGSISIIPNLINFVYVENTGAAFGMLSGNSYLLSFVSLIITGALIYIIINKEKYFTFKRIDYVLLLILSGAIGNFIDRHFRRFVVDFIDFDFMNFAVFNVADIYVVVGSVLMCIIVLFFEKEEEKTK